MGIAAMSIMLSQAKVQQQVGISVIKMAMEKDKIQINDLVQMLQPNARALEQAVSPHLGKNIDISL